MMGAIGTGNTRTGVITASFGTSGTIYACAEKAVVDPDGEIAAFCDSTNRWLPLLCTMNVTVATEMVREDFGWSHEKFAAEAARISAGSDGLLLLPYFEGERTPNVPDGTGVCFGVNTKFRSGAFRASLDGRGNAGNELRSAAPGGPGSEADSDSGDGRWSAIENVAPDHG